MFPKEYPLELIRRIVSYIPRDRNMKSREVVCIKGIIEDYNKIPKDLRKKLFKNKFSKYALLYIKAERNYWNVRLNHRFFNSLI